MQEIAAGFQWDCGALGGLCKGLRGVGGGGFDWIGGGEAGGFMGEGVGGLKTA